MEELMKVPDSVIIKQLQDEVKALRRKNHEVCTKAKEREAHWKAYTESLENAIADLESKDEEIRAVRREVKAQKKVNEDYQILLHSHNLLVLTTNCNLGSYGTDRRFNGGELGKGF